MGLLINVDYQLQMHGFRMVFTDTDDYMRLVRIRDFFSHYDLSNNVISRSNVPFGCSLHWTRFYDFFIIIPTYILNFFVNSINQSIEYVGFVIGPIIKSVTIMVFFNVCQKIMEKNDAFLLTAIFAAHPFILPFGIFGRPDHHSFIMLFIIVYLNSIIDIIESKFDNRDFCAKAATIAALCVWISPETLIPILLMDGVLFIHSFSNVEKLRCLLKKNLSTACDIGIIIFLFSDLEGDILTICCLLTVVPYAIADKKHLESLIFRYWHVVAIILLGILFPLVSTVEYDKISVLHMALFTFGALYFGIIMIYQGLSLKIRIVTAFSWFLLIAYAFLSMYPMFFDGMCANIDDYVKEIWLYRVEEMRSPFTLGAGATFTAYSVVTAIAMVSKVVELIRGKSTNLGLTWQILIANAGCYTVFAGISYRMLPYSALFGLPLIVDFGMNSDFTKSLHRLWRIIITAFLSILVLFCASYLDPEKESKTTQSPYTSEELFKLLDNLSPEPIVIMAHSNDGPAILYHTKHSVVGAPYHRQTKGIIFSYKIMEDEYDEEIAKSILKVTDSSYIFVRRTKINPKMEKMSLAHMIANNNLPNWLNIVELPKKFNDIIIAKIDKTK